MAEAAAAIVRLSRANVSAAEHGTEEGGRGRRRRGGRIGDRRYPPISLWVGGCDAARGPQLLSRSEIGAVGPLRRREKRPLERRNLAAISNYDDASVRSGLKKD
jgi:hypothetical protein